MNINKLLEKGEDALKKRNYDYAISIFLEAVSFAPDDRKARSGLRSAEMKKYEKGYPGAGLLFFTAMGKRFGMFLAGLGRKGNPEGFMMACERYLTKDPKSKKVNMLLGDAAAQAGHLNAAIFAYETAAEHDPNDVTALKKLGNLLWRNGEIQRAHETFDRAVKLAPQDQDAIKARKNVAAEASLKETGFETAKSSRDLVKDKDAAGKLEQEGRLYQTEEDLAGQRAALEARIAKEPAKLDLYRELAGVLVTLKLYDEATATLDRALKIKPDDYPTQFARGDVLLEQAEEAAYRLKTAGRAAEAAAKEKELLNLRTEEYRKRVKAYPTDLNLRFKLGDLLFARGEHDEAIVQYQQTVRDPKFRGESQLRLGRTFAAKGQYELAIRQLEQALEGQSGMTPRMKEVFYALAEVYEQMGQAERSREYFQKLYEVEIGYRDVAERLRKLESGGKPGTLRLSD